MSKVQKISIELQPNKKYLASVDMTEIGEEKEFDTFEEAVEWLKEFTDTEPGEEQ